MPKGHWCHLTWALSVSLASPCADAISPKRMVAGVTGSGVHHRLPLLEPLFRSPCAISYHRGLLFASEIYKGLLLGFHVHRASADGVTPRRLRPPMTVVSILRLRYCHRRITRDSPKAYLGSIKRAPGTSGFVALGECTISWMAGC